MTEYGEKCKKMNNNNKIFVLQHIQNTKLTDKT